MKTYLRHRIVNVIDVKELIALEYLDLDGKYKDYTESHDFWELCYVQKGELTRYLGDDKLSLSEGEMALVPPNNRHIYRSAKSLGCRAFVICFESPSQALKALGGGMFELDERQRCCLDIIIEEASKTFRMNEKEQLEVLSLPNFGGQQAIIAQLEYLLIYTLRKTSAKEKADVVFLDGADFYADLTDIIIKYFRKNITKRLTLEQICEKMNYSRSFLCRNFKQQTGESLIACFNRMKIDEAKRMLCSTDLSVARISSDLGFSDAKYFNTLFKKQIGVAPAVYRKQNRKETSVQ